MQYETIEIETMVVAVWENYYSVSGYFQSLVCGNQILEQWPGFILEVIIVLPLLENINKMDVTSMNIKDYLARWFWISQILWLKSMNESPNLVTIGWAKH